MDNGQYVKNPLYVSLDEFNNGMTKRKENKLRKEYRAQSNDLVKDCSNELQEKKKFFGDDWKADLRVVHSVNERRNIQRRRDLSEKFSSLSKD